MKMIFLIVLSLSISNVVGIETVFLNPGIKFGWEFGKKDSGFLLGAEVSAGIHKGDYLGYLVGGVLGCQYNFKTKAPKMYLETEVGTLFYGIAGGIEYIYGLSSYGVKPRLRAYGGMLGYLSVKILAPYEIGLVGKVPIPLNNMYHSYM